MPISYKVVQGDTFDRISRKVFGVETKADLIQKANPGVAFLTQGLVITIPRQDIDFAA